MTIETKIEALGDRVRYQATGSENTDNGAITVDVAGALGNKGSGLAVGATWPYHHQIAVHTTAVSGTFTVTVRPRGVSTAKNITDGVITLSATVADQIPILFDGLIDAVVVTPAGMTSEAYELSVCGVST